MNIEEKAREYDWQQELFNYMSNEHDVTMLNSDMHEVYMICQKDFTNATRWRKVEEELPEFGSVIVAKGETYDFQDMYLLEIDSDYSMSVLTSYYKEWKPID